MPPPHKFKPNPDEKFWQGQCVECGLSKKMECHKTRPPITHLPVGFSMLPRKVQEEFLSRPVEGMGSWEPDASRGSAGKTEAPQPATESAGWEERFLNDPDTGRAFLEIARGLSKLNGKDENEQKTPIRHREKIMNFIKQELATAKREGQMSVMSNDGAWEDRIRQEERERIVKMAEGMRKDIPNWADSESAADDYGYNKAIDELISLVRKEP